MEDLLLQWKIEKEELGSRLRQVVCTSIHKELSMELRYGVAHKSNGLQDIILHYLNYYEMTLYI